MMFFCLSSCVLLALLSFSTPAHAESYFGDSFCRIEATQDVSMFHLTLQFKTSRHSGLLVLAAGVDDYLVLELRNGRLQARMNVGSGELVLSSPLGLKLNNLVEHRVAVSLQDSMLTMLVDELFASYLPLPKAQEHINIDLGFYLGGAGDQQHLYLDNFIPPLRGCLSQVKFESQNFDLLQAEPMMCHDTKEGCSSEFDAGAGEAASLISPDSFISFPTWGDASTRILELMMKTTIEDALLVLNAGHRKDFIALGLVGGYLKGVLEMGRGAFVLDNLLVQLDDDQWHKIVVQIDRSLFQLTVDSQAVSVPLTGSEKLDLTGNLYFGGLEAKMRDFFHESGLLSRVEEEMTSESFIGCMGEIKVNQKEITLQDALVTKDVHAKCEGEDYDYPNYYDGYDTSTTTTVMKVQDGDLNTKESHCFPTDETPLRFRNITKLLDITTLLVPEGGEVFLDLNSISPTIDLNAVGISLSQIIFTLRRDPWYGTVDMHIKNKQAKKFTLLDVVGKKIKYVHDGNREYADRIQLEVVVENNNNIPECLKGPQKYVLLVDVIPLSNIPQLSGGDIKIIEYGRTRLSPNLIKIVDSDKRCDELHVAVTSVPSVGEGYLENARQPGKRIKDFTCRQLKAGNIYYVHKRGAVVELTLQLSDGHSINQSTTFSLSITQPRISFVTNTGLLLPHGGTTLISMQNLSVSASPKNVDILYNVTQSLQFGELQIVTVKGVMKKVTSFKQSDLEQEHLWYRSTDSVEHDGELEEKIWFDVYLGQFALRNNTFMVRISPSQWRRAQMEPLIVGRDKEKAVTSAQLQVTVKERTLDPETLRYTLVKAPILGTLKLKGKELMNGDGFTQQDLWNNALRYKAQGDGTVDREDQFHFRVSAENLKSPVYTYAIHILADSDVSDLINKRFVVEQNGARILNKTFLWVQTHSPSDFVYRLNNGPRYGQIIRNFQHGQHRFEEPVNVFGSEDLLLDRLSYKHDGSDSTEDQFSFQAFQRTKAGPSARAREPVVVNGVFRISIKPSDKHLPVRVMNKTLEVVRNGHSLLTTDVIPFSDYDSSFNESRLIYKRAGEISGDIVSAEDHTQSVLEFSQADLREGKVMFVHRGSDSVMIQLQVSDGVNRAVIMLPVHASEPFLHVANNTMIIIDYNSTKVLNTSYLSAHTNMYIRDFSEIRYEVVSPPKHGIVTVGGTKASWFTQEHLRKMAVLYQHNGHSLAPKDSFRFMVHCKGLSKYGTFRIKIFKQGYLSQPEILTNEVIISYEGEHTEIDEHHLKVHQDDILPSEMTFTIKDPPRLGHVAMPASQPQPGNTTTPSLEYIHSFSQEDVNQGRVVYVSGSIAGRDIFNVTVSNGHTTREDLRVEVQVVPNLIPVHTHNFTINEGGVATLSTDIISIPHPFYSSARVHFILEKPPTHGQLRYLEGEGDPSSLFTWDEVKQGILLYQHDGSETISDSFSFNASAFEDQRRSLLITLGISVLPVNDPPILALNTGVEILVGEEAEITRDMLSTEDADNPPEEIIYSVESLSSGIVALKDSLNISIQNFTQGQVNNGQLMFLHNGSTSSGGFNFTVTDGVHTTPVYSFVVMIRLLTITIEVTEVFKVFPGTTTAITEEVLKAEIRDYGDEITYTVLSPPGLGRLVSTSHANQSEDISSFTQSELASGSILFEHHLQAGQHWDMTYDSIELLLSSPRARDEMYSIPITVSYRNPHPRAISLPWKNTGLDVLHGETKVIDSSSLDASDLLASVPLAQRGLVDVLFEVLQFPAEGRLVLGSLDLEPDAPYSLFHFSQEDLNQGKLKYIHNNATSLSDDFTFRVHLNPREQDLMALLPSGVIIGTFGITVLEGAYWPPELVTQELLLEDLQGSTTPSQQLLTVSSDSPPSLVETVSGDPTHTTMEADVLNPLPISPSSMPLPSQLTPLPPSQTSLPPPAPTTLHPPGLLRPHWGGHLVESAEVDPTTMSPETNRDPAPKSKSSVWPILLPILIVLLLILIIALLAYYLLRRKKTGKHHIQPAATGPKTGEPN